MGVQVAWGELNGPGQQDFQIMLDAPNSTIIATASLAIFNGDEAAAFIPSYTVEGSTELITNPGMIAPVLAADNVTSVLFRILLVGPPESRMSAVFMITTL